MTPPQSFVEFEWEPNSQNQEFDQTISLRGDSSRHAADEGGVVAGRTAGCGAVGLPRCIDITAWQAVSALSLGTRP